jgi:hypothetical protein
LGTLLTVVVSGVSFLLVPDDAKFSEPRWVNFTTIREAGIYEKGLQIGVAIASILSSEDVGCLEEVFATFD